MFDANRSRILGLLVGIIFVAAAAFLNHGQGASASSQTTAGPPSPSVPSLKQDDVSATGSDLPGAGLDAGPRHQVAKRTIHVDEPLVPTHSKGRMEFSVLNDADLPHHTPIHHDPARARQFADPVAAKVIPALLTVHENRNESPPLIASGDYQPCFRSVTDTSERGSKSHRAMIEELLSGDLRQLVNTSDGTLRLLHRSYPDDPRTHLTHAIISRIRHGRDQHVHLDRAIAATRRHNIPYFAPYRLKIRTEIEQHDYREAWHWVREMIGSIHASRSQLDAVEYANALQENLEFAGTVAGFIAGPRRSIAESQIPLANEESLLTQGLPVSFVEAYNESKRAVMTAYTRQLKRETDFENDVMASNTAGYGLAGFRGPNSYVPRASRDENPMRNASHYDILGQFISRKPVTFSTYLPWYEYADRRRLLDTFDIE